VVLERGFKMNPLLSSPPPNMEDLKVLTFWGFIYLKNVQRGFTYKSSVELKLSTKRFQMLDQGFINPQLSYFFKTKMISCFFGELKTLIWGFIKPSIEQCIDQTLEQGSTLCSIKGLYNSIFLSKCVTYLHILTPKFG